MRRAAILLLLAACTSPDTGTPDPCIACPLGTTCNPNVGLCMPRLDASVSFDAPAPDATIVLDAPLVLDAPPPDARSPVDAPPPDAPAPDAPAPDAPRVLDAPPPPDAAPPDALPDAPPPPPDAPPPDARPPDAVPTGHVGVTTDDSNLVNWVAFQSASGQVTADFDASGTQSAGATVEAGSMVTAAFAWDCKCMLRLLYTVTGVQPGDKLSLGHDSIQGTLADISIQFTDPDPSAPYPIFSACDSAYTYLGMTSPVSRTVQPDCDVDGTVYVAGIAWQMLAAGQLPQYFAVADGNPGAMPWQTTLSAWAAPDDLAVSFTKTPAGATQIEVATLEQDLTVPAQSGTSGPMHLLVPPQRATHRFLVDTAIGSTVSARTMTTVPAGATASVSLGTLLPAASGVTVDASNLARQRISWNIAASDSVGTVVTVSWTNTYDFTWTLVVPAGTTAVKLPALPTAIAEFAPNVPVQVDSIELYASPSVTTYTAFRAGFRARVTHKLYRQTLKFP